jgi:hypothetical protein
VRPQEKKKKESDFIMLQRGSNKKKGDFAML